MGILLILTGYNIGYLGYIVGVVDMFIYGLIISYYKTKRYKKRLIQNDPYARFTERTDSKDSIVLKMNGATNYYERKLGETRRDFYTRVLNVDEEYFNMKSHEE